MDNTFRLDNARAFRKLGKMPSPIAVKRSISGIVVNETPIDLLYDTILADGETEVKGGVIPSGFAAVVQANGELHVLAHSTKRTSTFESLYAPSELTYSQAMQIADQRGLTIAAPKAIEDAMRMVAEKNGGQTVTPKGWHLATGRAKFFRAVGEMQCSWGTEEFTWTHLVSINLVTCEAYVAETSVIAQNWCFEEDGVTGDAMIKRIPAMSFSDFKDLMTKPAKKRVRENA